MKKYKSWMTVPLPEGEQDCNLTRMERWEKANNMELSDLPENEWIEVVSGMCNMTTYEAREWLGGMRAKNSW